MYGEFEYLAQTSVRSTAGDFTGVLIERLTAVQNPLEKKSIMRGEPGKAAETEGNPIEGVVEKAKQAVDDAKDAVSGGDKW